MSEKRGRHRWGAAATALFFAAHFLYVWLRIDPRLLYEGGWFAPPFRTGAAFLRQTLAKPGGVSEYLAAAGGQAYYLGWAGALCITGISLILFLQTRALVRLVGRPETGSAAFVPPLLVLAAYNAYGQPLVMIVSPTIALAGVLFYARLAPRNGAARMALFTALAVAVYWAAGGALILFALVGGIVEARARGDRLPGLVAFAIAESVPYAAGVLALGFAVELGYWRASALDLSLDGRGRPALVALTLFFPLLAAWLHARPAAEPARARRSVRPALLYALAALAAFALVHLSFSTRDHQLRRVHFSAARHDWPRVLEDARRIPLGVYTFDAAHNVYRALYHSGRLLTDLFAYPEHATGLAIVVPESTGTLEDVVRIRASRYIEIGEQALEFGLVNEAAQEGQEALAVYGDHATTLRRLAWVYIAKGMPDAARVYLNALRGDLVQGGWAREMLARLEEDPRLDGDVEMRQIRALMPQKDPGFFFSAPDVMCRLLLEVNPANRMAYEYLLAHHLLQRDPKAVVAALGGLERFGYTEIPPLCQEAIVLYESREGDPVHLDRYEMSPEAYQRFSNFSSVVAPLQEAGKNDEAKRAALAEFGDSFYYYYVFGETGAAIQ